MKKEINWKVFRYDELTTGHLYELLALRCRIFIVEQDCPYQDIDYKDQNAWHVCGYCDGKLVAYSRLFTAGYYFDEASIGRVIVDKDYRLYGFGKQLMERSIQAIQEELHEEVIVISAQFYLKRFYESFGFIQISEEYLEDDIPHIRMKLDRSKINGIG